MEMKEGKISSFEPIHKEILPKKLSMYGIQGKELKWFRSYLTNMTQRAEINQLYVSFSMEVNLGVPQRSILGAILFIININDMPEVNMKTQ